MANPTSSSLDILSEKIDNIEVITNHTNLKTQLYQALKNAGKRERETRKLTLTFSAGSETLLQNIIQEVEKVNEGFPPLLYWMDKSSAYIKICDKSAMKRIRENITNAPTGSGLEQAKEAMVMEEDAPKTLTRKPVRLEINNVNNQIKLDSIVGILQAIQGKEKLYTDFKEGKTIARNASRLISFRANSKGMEKIYKNYGGQLPLKNQINQNKVIRFYPKVNIKPYSCRECYNTQHDHKCPGRVCNNCGEGGHQATNCTKSTRFCSNCNKPGHRAKDKNCPRFIQAIIKEIQRHDLPMEFLEDSASRLMLINNLQLN